MDEGWMQGRVTAFLCSVVDAMLFVSTEEYNNCEYGHL